MTEWYGSVNSLEEELLVILIFVQTEHSGVIPCNGGKEGTRCDGEYPGQSYYHDKGDSSSRMQRLQQSWHSSPS